MASEAQRYTKKAALASEPQWSEYQDRVFEWMLHGKGNAQIGAVAGSGKTTLLEGIVNRVPADQSCMVLAFNVHIAEALQNAVTQPDKKEIVRKAIPGRVGIRTANAMGHSLLIRHFQGASIEVRANKYRRLAKIIAEKIQFGDVLGSYKGSVKAAQKDAARHLEALVNFCQSTLTEPTQEGIQWVRDYYALEITPAATKVGHGHVERALDMGKRMAEKEHIISFSDQLWLPHAWEISPVPKDWVLIDEVQDANPAQLALYKGLIGDKGRAILVGDENQSIMGFSGSDPEMWGRIHRELKTEILPLSVCYRCPTAVLDLARYFTPEIQPFQEAAGEIIKLHPGEIKHEVKPGDLLVCRFTAPLVELCLKLIIEGKQAKVRGKDIGASMVALLREACGGVQWAGAIQALNNHCTAAIQRLEAESEDEAADTIRDKFHALMACYQQFGRECQNLKQFCDRILNLFTDSESQIVLSTIHRAKGDEADRVFIVQCDALPYVDKCRHGWQEKQEKNLAYVALTRAKRTLFLVPLGKRGAADVDDLLSEEWAGMDMEAVTLTPPEPPPPADKDWPFKKDALVYKASRKQFGRVAHCWSHGWVNFLITDRQGVVQRTPNNDALPFVQMARVEELREVIEGGGEAAPVEKQEVKAA